MSENNNQSEDTRQSQSDEDQSDEEYKYNKIYYSSYLKERSETENASLTMSLSYQKYLGITIGGALTLFLNYFEKHIPSLSIFSYFAFCFSGLLLSLSMICILINIKKSITALERKTKNLDIVYSNQISMEDKPKVPIDKLLGQIEFLNNLSLWMTILGVSIGLVLIIITFNP